MFNQNNTTAQSGNQRKSADGFLNIQVVGADGQTYPVKCTIPLGNDNAVHRGLLEAAKADGNKQFSIVGTVKVMTPMTEADVPKF